MKKNLKRIVFLVIFLTVLIIPYLVFAADSQTTSKGALENMKTVGTGAGFQAANETTISTIAGTIVKTALGFLAVIFLLLILYAGFLWMTAQGESDKVDQAKKIIKNCVIGLILIIAAYGIYEVAARIIDATTGNQGGEEETPATPPPANDPI
jgi:hypothetical protein